MVSEKDEIKLPPTPHRKQPEIIIEEERKTELRDEGVQTVKAIAVNRSIGQSRQHSLRADSGASSGAMPTSLSKFTRKK